MDRREFLAAAGGLLIATRLPATEEKPILTFSRNGITLPFYEHEMPGNQAREDIRRIFYELDENTYKHRNDCDIPCWEWEDDGYRFPLDDLDRMMRWKFCWYAWFESDRFHLLQGGCAEGRFEYSNHKVCMFEREMYSGDGLGCARDKCLLPGPYEHTAAVVYHQANFNVKCDSYWTTTLPSIGPVVRWRYKAFQNGEPYGVRV